MVERKALVNPKKGETENGFSMHVLHHRPSHALAHLSEKAHNETAKGNNTSSIEMEIDDFAAQIWGLTREELEETKVSLEELS